MISRIALLLFLTLISVSASGQKIISGMVIDSAFGKPMASVTVENITLKSGTRTNYRGAFSIEANTDNYLKVSYTGYKPRIIRVGDVDEIDFLKIKLSIGRVQLRQVKITKPLTDYQIDSIERAKTYKDVFEYQQQKSVMSPVTSLYEKFSRKHRSMRNFKEQVLKIEKQKYIDTRYTTEMVSDITKLTGDDLAYFMNDYPMEIEFARTASELEIRMWVRYNWHDYQKKNQRKE